MRLSARAKREVARWALGGATTYELWSTDSQLNFPFSAYNSLMLFSRLRKGVKCHHLLLVLKEKLAPYLDQREFPHVQEHMTDRAAWESTRHEVTDSKQHRPVMQSARPAVLKTSWGRVCRVCRRLKHFLL